MSFFTLLTAIAKKKLTVETVMPTRTAAPLRLSQGSALTLSIVPVVLAEHAGSLFGHDIAERHTIVAVGRYAMMGLNFTRCYLSQSDGGYLHFATKGNQIVETRIYKPYAEQIPATAEEWAFWLADLDGYIGYPVMQSKDEDGPVQYQRSWSGGDARISPMQPVEGIVDSTGAAITVRHQMMHYTRALADDLAEHMLVSAVQTDDGMSVNFWLGINLDVPDLTVFPAVDARE